MRDVRTKAKSAADQARILLDAGRPDGAASRAYYAMFDAARVALATIAPELAEAKTHATILRRFSKHIVLERNLDSELGRMLRRAFEARLLADYQGPSVPKERAALMVDEEERFIAAIAALLGDIDD